MADSPEFQPVYACTKCERAVAVTIDKDKVHVEIDRNACIKSCREAVYVVAWHRVRPPDDNRPLT